MTDLTSVTKNTIKVQPGFEISSEVGILRKVFEDYQERFELFDEFAQGRTNFQIEKFIATEEATPAAAYKFTLFQTRVMRTELHREVKEAIEFIRTFDYKWKDVEDKTNPIWWEVNDHKKLCWYDTDEFEFHLRLQEMGISIKDKLMQLETFEKCLASMIEKNGRPFTRADFEKEEPEYWKLRFLRQMTDEVLGRMTGMSSGDIKSARMAIAPSPIPESKNQITDFPDVLGSFVNIPSIDALISDMQKYIQTMGQTEMEKDADTAEKTKQMTLSLLQGLEDYKGQARSNMKAFNLINGVNNLLLNSMANLGNRQDLLPNSTNPEGSE